MISKILFFKIKFERIPCYCFSAEKYKYFAEKFYINFILQIYCRKVTDMLQRNFISISFCSFFCSKMADILQRMFKFFHFAYFCRFFTKNLQTFRRHVHKIFRYIKFLGTLKTSQKCDENLHRFRKDVSRHFLNCTVLLAFCKSA